MYLICSRLNYRRQKKVRFLYEENVSLIALSRWRLFYIILDSSISNRWNGLRRRY